MCFHFHDFRYCIQQKTKCCQATSSSCSSVFTVFLFFIWFCSYFLFFCCVCLYLRNPFKQVFCCITVTPYSRPATILISEVSISRYITMQLIVLLVVALMPLVAAFAPRSAARAQTSMVGQTTYQNTRYSKLFTISSLTSLPASTFNSQWRWSHLSSRSLSSLPPFSPS